ncbi:NAD-dependent succinate-semialdehyde dehydrogenase [Roseibium denhamense]|uniref:Succinate-semialdehyde dehydrogenase / glutarate-semialdehyde dehydrogenase n=1 Tax=Roseibium denhamense TaxID=76305 RepID=A0ABY1NRN8_9HYPH|nr:NAD-dependent succinate-semialdehyde dehydrogenase [Roseibium denhamense]MTI08107.1 NAD-dependent succinate-semialdehyde dehydrogenase [Roseibium denhamense]SMP16484.1 succinate-semialdehyde dehydrogenase / glutarate-semialdehyde dehydrogenase [Roseibium denhamense]
MSSFNPAIFKDLNYIGGEWVGADSGQTVAVTNPATGDHIGSVPMCGRAETNRAIAAATSALPAWKALTADARATHMVNLCDAIMDHLDDLAIVLTSEMGKPLAEAKGEIALGVKYIRFFAEEGKRIYGDTIPSPWADRRIVVTKEPVGVAGAITPWNFPNSMIARKLGAALASGCTMVIKPSEFTPFSALAFGALADKAGLPKGVINILTGDAPAIGEEMCENPDLRKITFTGSTRVGKLLAANAGKHMKKISMELGGNAPFIVFDDADLDRAVEGAIASKFRNSGQTCVCANRIYVQAGVYDQFADKLKAAMEAQLSPGNGMEPDTTQGPLINEAAVDKVAAHVADALEKGATLVTGGKRLETAGTFYAPTLLTGMTQEMRVAHEETFGPLAGLFKFETEEDAIRLANDTEYGLACYFYSNGLGRTYRVMEQLQYGLVGVNEGVITTEVAPFGGVKDSGLGNEGSKYGLDDYLNIKYSCIGGLGL